VVLTPGSFNETYFEHAYLARQLGLPLVEGNDLTVRGDTVCLKTLGGLRRVHAIFRRLDDDFCDPVELRADSALGVPGLIGRGARRQGGHRQRAGQRRARVGGVDGVHPGRGERLLGEKLRLPSVATWWCGEKAALDYVVANIGRLVIKPAYPNQISKRCSAATCRRGASEIGGTHRGAAACLCGAGASGVLAGAGVAQSRCAGLCGARLGIRVYAIATPNGYRVMPGGLARIASDTADVVSMQRGGGSKDVWVLAADHRATDDASGASIAPRSPARHDELPSRLAENLFWLGRYSERCEDKARLLRATLGGAYQCSAVAAGAGDLPNFITMPKSSRYGAGIRRGSTPGAARGFAATQWCAAQTRSRLSAENWRAISVLQRQFQEAADAKADPRETLDTLLLSLAALAGFALDDMTQDDGWRLMMLGRRLERLQFLSELLALRLQSGRRAVAK
jgi:hypothetical protein